MLTLTTHLSLTSSVQLITHIHVIIGTPLLTTKCHIWYTERGLYYLDWYLLYTFQQPSEDIGQKKLSIIRPMYYVHCTECHNQQLIVVYQLLHICMYTTSTPLTIGLLMSVYRIWVYFAKNLYYCTKRHKSVTKWCTDSHTKAFRW